MTDDPLLRKCCDTCNHFWVDAPTRYSQCRKIDAQIDGEDIAFIIKIGCASHSSFTCDIPSSKELIQLATHDFKNREERKGLHDKRSWVSGWITGFLSERKPNWGKEREEKVRNDTLDEMIKLTMMIEEENTDRWNKLGRIKNDAYINGSHSGYGHALRDMRQWIDRIKQANGGMKI